MDDLIFLIKCRESHVQMSCRMLRRVPVAVGSSALVGARPHPSPLSSQRRLECLGLCAAPAWPRSFPVAPTLQAPV